MDQNILQWFFLGEITVELDFPFCNFFVCFEYSIKAIFLFKLEQPQL